MFKKTIANAEIIKMLHQISVEEIDEVESVKEGRVLYKLHKYRAQTM
jgi:hypothetical protein